MKTRELYESTWRLTQANAGLDYSLIVFGDHLAKSQGFKSVDGLDAVHLYLVNKHHWLPSQVRSMSMDDLRFALSEELEGWTLPKQAIF